MWQALPGQRARERRRALVWCIAFSVVLNGLWLEFAQFATLLLAVIGIVAVLVVLCVIFRIAVRTRRPGGDVRRAAYRQGQWAALRVSDPCDGGEYFSVPDGCNVR